MIKEPKDIKVGDLVSFHNILNRSERFVKEVNISNEFIITFIYRDIHDYPIEIFIKHNNGKSFDWNHDKADDGSVKMVVRCYEKNMIFTSYEELKKYSFKSRLQNLDI